MGTSQQFTFVSGGARSGKSAWAETQAINLAAEAGSRLVYIAAARADDAEMRRRVERHKAARKDKGFETLEWHTDAGGAVSLLPPGCVVLLECLGTLLANEMFGHKKTGGTDSQKMAPPDFFVQKIFGDILSLRAHAAHLLVVSNDVFSDGVTYNEPTENYRRALGALHVKLAAISDLAVECVCSVCSLHVRAHRSLIRR